MAWGYLGKDSQTWHPKHGQGTKRKKKKWDSNLFRKLLKNQKDSLQPGTKILANPIYDQGVVYTYIKNLQNAA